MRKLHAEFPYEVVPENIMNQFYHLLKIAPKKRLKKVKLVLLSKMSHPYFSFV